MSKLKTARVFLKATRLTDDQCNTAVSSQTLPTAGWIQLFTKGEVSIEHARESEKLMNDQNGVTGIYITDDMRNIKIPFESTSFDELTQYCIVDPNYDTGDYYFLMKSNRGEEITGVSLLIYDKDLDPTNNTNVPNLSLADQSARLIFNAVIDTSVTEKWDGSQDILEASFTAVSNTGSGSAKGVQGVGGRITAS